MSQFDRAVPATDATRRSDCPCWCITVHDPARGEEDWVHEGAPITVDDGVLARLCLSLDPDTGAVDGPYVVVGARELTVEEAESLGVSFIGLAVAGTAFSRPAAGGTHSPDR